MILWGKNKQKSYEDMNPEDYNKTCLARYAQLCNNSTNVMAVANHLWIEFNIEFVPGTINCANSPMDV